MRKLKKFNGRGHGKYSRSHFCIAAYSMAQCARLLSEVCDMRIGVNEINDYWYKCWGNAMDGINPDSPCVYVSDNTANTYKRILKK